VKTGTWKIIYQGLTFQSHLNDAVLALGQSAGQQQHQGGKPRGLGETSMQGLQSLLGRSALLQLPRQLDQPRNPEILRNILYFHGVLTQSARSSSRRDVLL
jgi:hypothetical protein